MYKIHEDLITFGKIKIIHTLGFVSCIPHYLQAPLGGGGRSGALSVTLRAALKVTEAQNLISFKRPDYGLEKMPNTRCAQKVQNIPRIKFAVISKFKKALRITALN